MENVRIASTPLAGLMARGQASDRDRGRLTERLAELVPDIVDLQHLFADPEPSRDGRRIDWYGPAGKDYVALSSLPANEQAAVLDRVDNLFAVVRREGERLRLAGEGLGEVLIGATLVPEPRDSFIYVARDLTDPDRWWPVVVCWAYLNEAAMRSGAAPQVMVRPVDRSGADRSGATPPAVEHGVVLAVAPAPVLGDRRDTWSWLLWIALLALLLAIAWLMLKACGLVLPGYGVLHSIGRTFCPASAVAATLTGDDDRSRALSVLARQLEIQITQKKASCLALARHEAEVAATTQPRASPSIDERLKREGAKTGELQVSLAWNGTADLDLHVFCPDGQEIYYSRKSTCGGTLDVDMNSEKKSMTPVENVFWPDGKAPKGRYRVVVTLYGRHEETRPSIPFEVRIKNGGEDRTVPGTVSQERTPVEVTEFSR